MDKYYWALLRAVPGLGNGTVRKLKEVFSSGEEAYKASRGELLASKCFQKAEVVDSVLQYREKYSLNWLENKLSSTESRIISIDDEDYPEELKEIYNPPEILYCRGEIDKSAKRIAIVGSRKSSAYGEQVAKEFAISLAQNGISIVSGAAKGIDAAAHWGALTSGSTIGVLGCGLDQVYPYSNRKLYEKIIENGALLTEYIFGTGPLATNFPARNRIIAGISQGVLVVEATGKSGSLITAELANSEGRDVYAVPGSIYSVNSIGTHRLIQEGAKLVTTAEEILEEYSTELKIQPKEVCQSTLSFVDLNLSSDEAIIYEILDYITPMSVDEIIYKTRDKLSNVSFILLQMKLKGIVNEITPNYYLKSN